MSKIVNVLHANIYKHNGEDCSNGGISSRWNEILLLCPDGNKEVDLDNPPENLCKVVKRKLPWGEYVHIEPYAKAEGVGWMAGGTVISTSDARFYRATGVDYPVSFHDRDESQELYDKLSR